MEAMEDYIELAARLARREGADALLSPALEDLISRAAALIRRQGEEIAELRKRNQDLVQR
jgi:hypothetical protein